MLKVLTVITARGGSKGIPKKNIVPLCGKPLLAYTIECVIEANLSGKTVVSTDDKEIAAVAAKYEIEVIKRPPEISGDTASSESALLHALDTVEKKGFKPDAVVTLQPTSPLRKASTLRKFVEEFEKNMHNCDAMLSLNATRSFFWVSDETDGCKYKPLFPNAPRRRQSRKPIYVENSALYITSIEALRKTNSVLGTKTAGFIIDNIESLDINEPLDLAMAELLLSNPRYAQSKKTA